MAAKLGLEEYIEEHDETLINDLLDILATVETDMTIFFRQLAKIESKGAKDDDTAIPEPLLDAYYQPDQLDSNYRGKLSSWLLKYRQRLNYGQSDSLQRIALMNRTNPKYVLRNYLAQVAIERAESGDYSRIHELLELLRYPYDEQPEKEQFYKKRPEWARDKAGCSMLS